MDKEKKKKKTNEQNKTKSEEAQASFKVYPLDIDGALQGSSLEEISDSDFYDPWNVDLLYHYGTFYTQLIQQLQFC